MAQERIGLIGLGSMGRGIGKNLIGHGYPLTVHDANPAANSHQASRSRPARTPQAVRTPATRTANPNGNGTRLFTNVRSAPPAQCPNVQAITPTQYMPARTSAAV